MSYIEREAAILEIQRHGVGAQDFENFTPEQAERFVIGRLQSIPAADVVPVVHGRWNVGGMFDDFCVCNVCGFKHPMMSAVEFNYCPNCGVKMDKGGE